ncbi:MAG TPA: hypothetical protein VL359_03750, partial [bacterium]|nr:hypothetical protein [bacterium]
MQEVAPGRSACGARWAGGGCWGRLRRCSRRARHPLAGLPLALRPLQVTGLLDCARHVYGRLLPGFFGLDATLLALVFLALAGAPRAEGATRIPPSVLGLDRAPEVKTIRR